jgi:hypothetical protein
MHTVESVSALLKNMRDEIKKGNPVQITHEFVGLVELVNCINGLTFTTHYGEIIDAIVKGNCCLKISETVSIQPARKSPPNDSNPHSTSEPRSISNPPTLSEPTNTSKPDMESGSKNVSNPQTQSGPTSISNPPTPSNLFSVRSSDIWACDNEKCGKPDLILELQKPAGEKTSEQIRYQCLTCCFIGTAELTREEIEKAMAENKPVNFEINKTNVFDFLNQPRPKKRKTKAEKEAEAVAAEGQPLIDAIEAGQQHMQAIAQEGREPARKKKEGSADATTFQGGPPLPSYGQAQGSVVAPVAPAAAPEAKAAVQKILSQEVSQVRETDVNAALKDLSEIVKTWPLERLVKEWETMTGKTYKQGVTVPDAMQIEVVNRLAGVPVG